MPSAAREPQRLVRLAGQDPLIGHDGARVDVHADEGCARHSGDREGGGGIITQHIHAEKEALGRVRAEEDGGGGHRRDGHGGHGAGIERGVTEVLDDRPVGSSLSQDLEIRHGGLEDRIDLAPVTGTAWQGSQMDHPEEQRWAMVCCEWNRHG